MTFFYVFIKNEFPLKNVYALRVNQVAIIIYNKLILLLSELDPEIRELFYHDIYCIYTSNSFSKPLKLKFILELIEILL